jgi:Cyclophilin-like family
MWMTVGERRFSITLADNEAAHSFAALLPLTLDMPDLNGNEKHVKLPRALPANASRPRTIRNGDLMLWGADTLVVFYKTFDSPYSYTRLGRIDDPAALPQMLGRGEVRIVFTKKPEAAVKPRTDRPPRGPAARLSGTRVQLAQADPASCRSGISRHRTRPARIRPQQRYGVVLSQLLGFEPVAASAALQQH